MFKLSSQVQMWRRDLILIVYCCLISYLNNFKELWENIKYSSILNGLCSKNIQSESLTLKTCSNNRNGLRLIYIYAAQLLLMIHMSSLWRFDNWYKKVSIFLEKSKPSNFLNVTIFKMYYLFQQCSLMHVISWVLQLSLWKSIKNIINLSLTTIKSLCLYNVIIALYLCFR